MIQQRSKKKRYERDNNKIKIENHSQNWSLFLLCIFETWRSSTRRRGGRQGGLGPSISMVQGGRGPAVATLLPWSQSSGWAVLPNQVTGGQKGRGMVGRAVWRRGGVARATPAGGTDTTDLVRTGARCRLVVRWMTAHCHGRWRGYHAPVWPGNGRATAPWWE